MLIIRMQRMFLLIGFAAGLFACNSSDDFIDDPQAVKVLNVEADINFDLSSRSNWNFIVGSYRYDFSVADSKIMAVPVSESNTYAFSVTLTDRTGQVYVELRHANYYTRMVNSVTPDLEDQSTPAKFTMRDVLCGDYSALADETIKVSLYHKNALLLFNTEGLPEEAKVYVEQIYDQTITPLRDENNPTAYRAIVFPDNNKDYLFIRVEIGDDTYKAKFPAGFDTRANMPYPYGGIGHSAIVEFTLTFNSEEKELKMKDVKRTPFTREWPITQ